VTDPDLTARIPSGAGGEPFLRLRFRTGCAPAWELTSTVSPLAAICEKFVGMARLFGTDGVRGVANQDLTAELALGLGSAAARRVGSVGGHARRIAVGGRDPRARSEMLEAAVIAGVTSEGVDALRVGVLPTPAVAYLTNAYDADFGVMISASQIGRAHV
jgi:phosphoglucosamine mutase